MSNAQEIINLYNSGLSIKKIAKQLHHSNIAISSVLKENNISLRVKTPRNSILTQEQQQILDGLILGGANLHCPKHNARFKLETKDLALIKHIQEVIPLSWMTYPSYKNTRWILSSKTDIALNSLYEKWYKDGQKTLENYCFSPLSMKYWFYKSGYIENTNIIFNVYYIKDICSKFPFGHILEDDLLRIKEKSAIIKFFYYIGECNWQDFVHQWELKPPHGVLL